ncbi:hypothetical protein NPIL_645891 [Nephila pilipes]|uniref:Uncharacterized protein n=1 Tax=Nephila pilipes TaxID=299642 RepID=A0A8X6TSP7_NEPPI|nr:hypothetical protein NPIL_645891 [Nephila pilipes]
MHDKLPYPSPIDNQTYTPVHEAKKIAFRDIQEHHEKNKAYYDSHYQASKFMQGDLVKLEEIKYPNTRKLSASQSGPYNQETIIRCDL